MRGCRNPAMIFPLPFLHGAQFLLAMIPHTPLLVVTSCSSAGSALMYSPRSRFVIPLWLQTVLLHYITHEYASFVLSHFDVSALIPLLAVERYRHPCGDILVLASNMCLPHSSLYRVLAYIILIREEDNYPHLRRIFQHRS
jgi:hypothetical protein